MAETLAPMNLFRRLAFILIAVVGLISLIVSGWLLAGQTWDRAGGVVGQGELATPVWVGVASSDWVFCCLWSAS
jgi:hypothetical protein